MWHDVLKRREFIALVGGATAWPFAVRAQQPARPVVGYLSSLGQAVSVQFDAAFRRGLSQMGFVEGQNVSTEYRWITDSYDPLPAMAADLVQRQVAVICALGPPAVLAAKAATTSIPIVFVTGADQSDSALLPASTGRVETLLAFGLSPQYWRKNDWSCCTNWCPKPNCSRYSLIRQVRLPSRKRGTRRARRTRSASNSES